MANVKSWLDKNVQRFVSRKFLAWGTATFLVANHALTSEDWLKHYWYWPVIIVLLVVSTVTGTSAKEKIFEMLLKQKEGYEEELEILKKVNQEKELEKNKTVGKYQEELEKIEKEHNLKLEEREEEKREELVRAIEENKDKTEKLAEEVAKTLSVGFLKKNR